MPPTFRIATAQIAMRWTTAENTAAIASAMRLAASKHAQLCAFSELAITGFHREIARESRAELVVPAIEEICQLARDLSLAVALGAPMADGKGSRFNAHLLIDEQGRLAAEVRKRGLTEPEASFFARGSSRPVARLQGRRCSAVICREVSDLEQIHAELPAGSVDLILVPGALRQDPDKPRTDPPEYVAEIQRLAEATQAFVVHTNWPNALNRPEESADAGGSTVANPAGEVLLRLAMSEPGIGIFNLGERHFDWYPQ